MKKKFFAIILAFAMLLTSLVSINDVSFAEEALYRLYKVGDTSDIIESNDESDFVNKVSEKTFDDNANYVMELKADFVVPADGGNLKTITLNGKITVEGKGHTITGASDGTDGNRLIKIMPGSNVTINNLNLEGDKKYAGIEASGNDTELTLNSCTFKNFKAEKGAALNCDAIKTLNINSSEFTDCEVVSDEAKGGAIYAIDTKGINIKNTIISKCKGAVGPAIYCEGEGFNFNMEGSIVDSCEGSLSYKTLTSSGIYLTSKDVNNESTSVANIVNSKIRNCKSISDEVGPTIHGALSLNGLDHTSISGSNLTNNKITVTEGREGFGAAIYSINTQVDIKNSSNIKDNIILVDEDSIAKGGAVNLVNSPLTIDTCTITDNKITNNKITVPHYSVDNTFGGALKIDIGPATIRNSTISNNSCVGAGGAIYFSGGFMSGVSPLKTEAFTIENSTVMKNKAVYGGALYLSQALSKIENTKLIANEAKGKNRVGAISGFGGAIVATQVGQVSPNAPPQGHVWALDIDGGEISDNYAELAGGAIRLFTESLIYKDWDYDLLTEEIKRSDEGLTVNKNVIFNNNKTNTGYFNPPDYVENYQKAYIHDSNSLRGKLVIEKNNKFKHVESLLNNYDIDYLGNGWVFYDPNGGSGDIFVDKNNEIEFEYDEDSYELKDVKQRHVIAKTLAETNISNSRRFLGWNTEADGSGTKYLPGQTIDVKGNLTLFAQWEKPEARQLILTLDENYRGGRITDHEVEEGELIAPYLYIPRRRGYTFRGWSYDRKHLEEVKPDDRIYTDTTLYAIWKKAEIEKHEEPEEIRGDDHKAYIFGYPNGTVRPNGNITRAEAAAMLARLLNIEAIGSSAKPNFKDTKSAWYNKAINAVVARGIMKGYPDGRFRPNAPITRAEFTQMISTIDNKPYGEAPFIDVKGHWAERAIGSEYQAKRITGYPDGLFRPDANITRAEAAVILNKIFERNFDNLSLLKCKNILLLKRFIDLDETFWGYNDMVEATNTHEYVRRYKEDMMKRLEEDWLLIKDIKDIK
ncbi:S-layer homology domain-containing protein [Fenollaria massiliensis]|uniref:S-layer homology domain-containing protein n=1 Tax=Fenollaria massiliensis TaxID=938288 RepID=A0A9E7DJJ3_9FIRM|nr:S-layer homology domain-containing protein [Fenollaria massiliensis]UQK59026.1 S-layer homology domain-containing protein [Fenollaria massiliensis]